MRTLPCLLLAGRVLLDFDRTAAEQTVGETQQYLEFVRAQAAQLRAQDHAPTSRREWRTENKKLRTELERAWGGFPPQDAALKPQLLGVLERDGYRIEKIIFQTFPGVWMTANAYVPSRGGKSPALLMVHGHWKGAKQDPVVQARCIGAVKLGFFVLAVDAFGAGERGVGKALGEYHGDMTAATLLPAGLPLSGLQVYENMRAVDYLQSRPEVDPDRIGVTGASGGGNQSMYAGAWDERLAAAAPVCSVGNYQAYLGAACCMCEVVPGALRFTEEWAVLGLMAPRALLVINATRDSRQFSVEESNKSLEKAGAVFRALGKPENVRHVIFESGHDYSQAMREAVYGWMTLHLKHSGSGKPISEPAIIPENPESLRCFPGDTRPEDWLTIPRFAAVEGRKRIQEVDARRKGIYERSAWVTERTRLQKSLTELLGGFPQAHTLESSIQTTAAGRTISFSPEPGIRLSARQEGSVKGKILIAIDLEGATNALAHPELQQVRDAGWSTVTLSLRGTGEFAWPSDKVGRAPDHTTAEWALWIGRPLLGQWVWDIRRLIDAIAEADGKAPGELCLAGFGPAGVVALAAGALDERITRVAAMGTLATYISDAPYENQRLGTIVPAILQRFGDVPDFAALIAPRRLLITGGVLGNGRELDLPELRDNYIRAQNAYALVSSSGRFQITRPAENSLRNFLSE